MNYSKFSIGLRVDGVVYNGIDLDLFPLQIQKQDYLLWLGRLSGIKGTDLAVQVARRTKRPLIVAGEIHNLHKEFFETKINPFVTHRVRDETDRNFLLEQIASGEEVIYESEILFIGPVDDKQKAILYGNAYATLQPNRWKEPFGLVPVESMACGTPVIVTNRGALPELVIEGKTGFVVESQKGKEIDDETIIEETIGALRNIPGLNPEECRQHIQRNFSIEQMTQNYIKIYQSYQHQL